VAEYLKTLSRFDACRRRVEHRATIMGCWSGDEQRRAGRPDAQPSTVVMSQTSFDQPWTWGAPHGPSAAYDPRWWRDPSAHDWQVRGPRGYSPSSDVPSVSFDRDGWDGTGCGARVQSDGMAAPNTKGCTMSVTGKKFEGTIGRTFDDSVAWWPPLDRDRTARRTS